jgi:hypothetical protein
MKLDLQVCILYFELIGVATLKSLLCYSVCGRAWLNSGTTASAAIRIRVAANLAKLSPTVSHVAIASFL